METTTQPTLMDHVHELRGRLLCTVAVFSVGAVVGYLLRVGVIHFLQSPLHEALYYTTPTGSFEFIMKASGLIGLIAALPVLIYNLLRFLEPALPRRLTKTMLAMVVGLSFCLAMAGVAFAYYVSLPSALHFFGSISSDSLKPLISIDQYFRFVFAYLTTFAVVFQLPLLVLIVDHITPLGPGGMRKGRKFVIAGAFGVGILTPATPDPLSQVILALPVILLYEASFVVVWVRSLRRRGKVVAPAVLMTSPPVGAMVRPAKLKAAGQVATSAIMRPAARTQPLPRRLPVAALDLRAINTVADSAPRPPANILDLRSLA